MNLIKDMKCYFDVKNSRIDRYFEIEKAIEDKKQEALNLGKYFEQYKAECEELIKSSMLGEDSSNRKHVEERFNRYFVDYIDKLGEIKKATDDLIEKKNNHLNKYPEIKEDIEKGEKEVKQAMKHSNKLGAGAKKRKKLHSGKDKFKTVMEEFKRGTLHSSDGKIVTDRNQAIAIAYSESGMSKAKVEESIVTLVEAYKEDMIKMEKFQEIQNELEIFLPKIEKANNIKGGLADNKTVEDIAEKHGVTVKHINRQLKMGLKVEKEHTDSEEKAKEIAMDHLTEDPSYYTKLAKMESGDKKTEKSEEDEIEKAKEETQFTSEQKKKIDNFIKNYKGDFEDKDIHDFANKMKLNKHEVEEYIYSIAKKKLKKAEDNMIAEEPKELKTRKRYADAILRDKDDYTKILFLRRSNDSEFAPNLFGLIGGHIDNKEEPEEAMKREVKEETGIELEEYYKVAEASKPEIHYYESNIDSALIILDNKEHKNWKWFKLDELKEDELIPGLKDKLYKIYNKDYKVKKV